MREPELLEVPDRSFSCFFSSSPSACSCLFFSSASFAACCM